MLLNNNVFCDLKYIYFFWKSYVITSRIIENLRNSTKTNIHLKYRLNHSKLEKKYAIS